MDLVRKLKDIAADTAPRILPFGTVTPDQTTEGMAAKEIEKLRTTLTELLACPDPIKPEWTMRQCFDARKCSCVRGIELGYVATTTKI